MQSEDTCRYVLLQNVMESKFKERRNQERRTPKLKNTRDWFDITSNLLFNATTTKSEKLC